MPLYAVMPPYISQIEKLGACDSALFWLRKHRHPSLEAAWAACPRGDWMLWLIAEIVGPPDDPARVPLVLAACDCVELTLPLVPAHEQRPRQALDTVRAWARGEATPAELSDAREQVDEAASSVYLSNPPAFVSMRAIAAITCLPISSAPYAFVVPYGATNPNTFAAGADLVRTHYPVPPVLPE